MSFVMADFYKRFVDESLTARADLKALSLTCLRTSTSHMTL